MPDVKRILLKKKEEKKSNRMQVNTKINLTLILYFSSQANFVVNAFEKHNMNQLASA